MKNILTIFILLISLTTFAEYRDDWEKPLLTDNSLKVLSSNGIFGDYEDFGLSLNRRPRADHPTSITLRLTLDATTQEYQLYIESREGETCGSLYYNTEFTEKSPFILTLVDHSQRHCDDFQNFKWEVFIESGKSTAELLGTPSRVITIQ